MLFQSLGRLRNGSPWRLFQVRWSTWLEKPAWIHWGQTLLANWVTFYNLLCWCELSNKHQLTGFFQGFQYSFPQSPPREADVSESGQVVQAVDGELASNQHPECGGKWLLKLATCHKWGPQGSVLGLTLVIVIFSDVKDGIKCTLRSFQMKSVLRCGCEESYLFSLHLLLGRETNWLNARHCSQKLVWKKNKFKIKIVFMTVVFGGEPKAFRFLSGDSRKAVMFFLEK